ncbi:DUF4244 domain-containing protein [Saccharopolyspora cebuensis]|uniref:DUF4244 domain-containing protein n=1 Tax=Saccharopolyspora cebuensis TaxID=418759 RepID=A0ABV4CJ97_9PSEU
MARDALPVLGRGAAMLLVLLVPPVPGGLGPPTTSSVTTGGAPVAVEPVRKPRMPSVRRIRALLRGDGGMSTAEYAMGTVAAVAFASVLFAVVTSDPVKEALAALINRALQGGGS